MSQQPLFVYVPQVITRPLSEATPAEERVETAGIAAGSQTILPDQIDKIWHEFFEILNRLQQEVQPPFPVHSTAEQTDGSSSQSQFVSYYRYPGSRKYPGFFHK